MGCRFCTHWKAFERTEEWHKDSDAGECRRYPKTEHTNASDYCGELRMSSPSYVNMFYWQRNAAWDKYRSEVEKRKAAEKKLMARNKQIREMRDRIE